MLSPNHFCLKTNDQVRDICKGLIDRYSIQIFVHVRSYQNGSCTIFSNHPDWLYHHFNQGYLVPAPVPKDLLQQKEACYYVTPHGAFQQAKQDLVDIFQSGSCFYLIYKLNDGYEIFSYAFDANNHDAVNTFLNNMDSFKKFGLYFKEKAARLIQSANKHRIMLPHEMQGIKNYHSKTITQGDEYNELVEIKKFRLNTAIGEITLTKREIDCIRYFIKGYTYKEIGSTLDLSHRTVETYLDNAQSKLGCQNKSQMIDLLLELYPLIK